MRKRRRTWFLRRLALGLAVALVAVPTAQARPDEGSVAREPGYVPFQTDFPRSVSDRPVPANYGLPQKYGLPQDYGVRTVQAAQPGGFDWSDAGIGAGSALVLVLLTGGAVLAMRHTGRPVTA